MQEESVVAVARNGESPPVDTSTIPLEPTWGGNLVAIAIVGAGIGWLVGLSVSPTVANVVAALVAIVATLVATLGGWEQTEDKPHVEAPQTNATPPVPPNLVTEVNSATTAAAIITNPQPTPRFLPRIITPWPFAFLMIGLFLGSVLGLCARNYSWFGSNLSYEVEKWTDQGMNRDEVVRRLFESEYPYTPYVQSWLWITDSRPITSSLPVSATIVSPQVTSSSALSTEIELWANLGLNRTEVVSRFFELKYPISLTTQLSSNSQEKSENNTNAPGDSVLYALTVPEDKLTEICNAWIVYSTLGEDAPTKAELWNNFKAAILPTGLHEIVQPISDEKLQSQIFEIILKKICPSSQ